MCILGASPAITAQQVCEITAIDKAAVSRSLQRLAKLNFVAFNTIRSDSRAKTIELSSRGREVHDVVIQMALEREEILLSVLTGEEKKHLIRSLQKLRSNVPNVNKWKPSAIKHGGGKSASRRS
jgi:DNA-binding MarR family transcriptional regulator